MTTIFENKKNKKCIFVKSNGTNCNARAMNRNDFCYFHSPDIPDDVRKEQKRNGGKAKVLVIPANQTQKEIALKNPKQVSKFYAYLINQVMSGEMDLRLATGLSYMLNGLLKALELSEMEQRLSEIENKLENKGE